MALPPSTTTLGADEGSGAVLARKMWRTLEPFHAMVYFVPEADRAYEAVGLEAGRMGYVASRSAPMGAVSATVVGATFFNFNPALIERVIPRAWELADPGAILWARLRAADSALRRLLGPAVDSSDMARAADLARAATEACRPDGRPLYAGHASLEWPDEPHLVLWHAISLLREFRGDGHISALVTEGVTGIQALVMHAAVGDIPRGVLQTSRAWPDADWAAAEKALATRGWLGGQGEVTEAGLAHRGRVEDLTDQLSLAPWTHVGDEAGQQLRQLVRPWSQAITEAGTFAHMPS
ncbi:MAG: SCO6745 family protein [Acidimicrobiales bacterium]